MLDFESFGWTGMEKKWYIIGDVLAIVMLPNIRINAPRGKQLTEADNGKTVTVGVGEELAVTLAANPTTGYTWAVAEPANERIIQQTGKNEFESKSRALGAGGVQIFRFVVVGAGQTTLKLIYHRPWESVEPVQRFSIWLVAQ